MPVGLAIGGAAASIGGAALGASAQKKAANKAADTSLAVAEKNNALAREIYAKNEANISPWMTRGNTAGVAQNALLGLGGDPAAQENAFDQFRASTGYDFRQQEGMNALNSGYAAKGMLQSGAAQKAAIRYGQDYGSNEFANYFNMLNGQNQLGFSGASALAGVGQNMVGQVTANNNSAGSAAANAALMKGQATANMWSGIGGSIGNVFGSSF